MLLLNIAHTVAFKLIKKSACFNQEKKGKMQFKKANNL